MNDPEVQMMQLHGSGYCCAQILVILCLENMQRENPDLVRSTQGLCMGTGDFSGTCGILTGGICALSLYGGKGLNFEESDTRLPLAVENFREWFSSETTGQYGGTNCENILDGECAGPRPDRCGKLLVESYSKIISILTDAGFDPTEGRETGNEF